MCNNDSCGHFVLKLTAQHISLQNKISKEFFCEVELRYKTGQSERSYFPVFFSVFVRFMLPAYLFFNFLNVFPVFVNTRSQMLSERTIIIM